MTEDPFKDYPPLHNHKFGGFAENKEWAGMFYYLRGNENCWEFSYLTPNGDHIEELTAQAPTPGKAFQEVVDRWIGFNNGEMSPTLRDLYPILVDYFNPDGTLRLDKFLRSLDDAM